MRIVPFAIAAAAVGLVLSVLPASASSIPMDTPTMIDGVDTVCTGIGDESQHDPRWAAYPVRIEFSNGAAQYLSGAKVTLSQGGRPLASVDCSGSWVLFKLAPGKYEVSAVLDDEPGVSAKSATIFPPANGQKRFVLQFPVAANH